MPARYISDEGLRFMLLVAAAYAFVIWPAGYLVGRLLRKFTRDNEELTAGGLEEGGLWIGRLERALVLTFVLMGQYQAIGFVIVAKSILRFGEVSPSRPGGRKMAEYVLIGTMLSLLLALAAGLGVIMLHFRTWLPMY